MRRRGNETDRMRKDCWKKEEGRYDAEASQRLLRVACRWDIGARRVVPERRARGSPLIDLCSSFSKLALLKTNRTMIGPLS